MPDFALKAWIHPLAVESSSPTHWRLLAPSVFHLDRVRSRFVETIQRCLEEELGGAVRVELALREASDAEPDEDEKKAHAPTPEAPEETEAAASAEGERAEPGRAAPVRVRNPGPLQLSCTFDTFVVGPANALAREASLAVAQGRQPGVTPLYLLGPSGSGKSHLAHALVAEARRTGEQHAVYCSAESFTSELTRAIFAKETSGFRERYRENCRLLVLDDVQFLEGKKATQMELFHTLEHLRMAGGGVVMTGDRLPREMKRLDPRLASYMSAGLVAEMELPDAKLRRDILREKAARGGVHIPKDCLDLLVEEVRGSVRDLEGVLIQLVASASLLGRRIDLELTRDALRKVAHAQSERLTIDAVIGCVASFFGVTREQLASRSRRKAVLVPRQLAMYLCHSHTEASLSEIGRALDRDHPSVRNAIEVVERAILERAPLRYQVEELASRLEKRA